MHLTSLEPHRDLDAMTVFEEVLDVRLLRQIVVRPNLRPEPDLLDLLMSLLLACFFRPDGLLVLEFPVVHDLADRRVGVRGNLDEIEPCGLRLAQSLLSRDDPDLGSVRSD